MGTIREVRQALVAASRRHGRVGHEAEDVAHDIIVAALRRGLALEGDSFARTADASARRHGAFVARSAARRRARELLCVLEAEVADSAQPNKGDGVAASLLPSALHTTLLLLSLGHTRSELRSALGISDAALRKRLQGLRERAPLARPQFAERGAGAPGLRRAQVECLPRLAPRLEGPHGSGRLIGISSNILADRLARLVEHGLLTKSDDPTHKQKAIYSLTEKAITLLPVVVQIGAWGSRWVPDAKRLDAPARKYVREIQEGGPRLWAKRMAELRAAHLR